MRHVDSVPSHMRARMEGMESLARDCIATTACGYRTKRGAIGWVAGPNTPSPRRLEARCALLLGALCGGMLLVCCQYARARTSHEVPLLPLLHGERDLSAHQLLGTLTPSPLSVTQGRGGVTSAGAAASPPPRKERGQQQEKIGTAPPSHDHSPCEGVPALVPLEAQGDKVFLNWS